MPVYPGFGVNYKNAQANWSTDRDFYSLIGLDYLRINLFTIPIPWSVGTPNPSPGNTANENAYWRSAAAWWKTNTTNWIGWGVSQPPNASIGSSNWQSYHDAVISECTYLVSQGIALDEFAVGNELENDRKLTVTSSSLSQAGGVATFKAGSTHSFVTGDTVTVYGAAPSQYNGSFTVTVINSTTFTYSVPVGTQTFASTQGIAYSLSLTQLNINLRQLGTDIKAIPGWSSLGTKVSYACNPRVVNGVSVFTDWMNNGLGGLDSLSIHIYASINVANQTVSPSNFPLISTMINSLGINNCYVSEFNLDSSASDLSNLNPVATSSNMSSLLNTYVLGVTNQFFVFEGQETLNNTTSEAGFAQVLPNGFTNPMFYNFFSSNPTQYSRGSRTSTSRTSVNRTSVSRTSYPTRPLFNSS